MNNKKGLKKAFEDFWISLIHSDVKKLDELILDEYTGFTLNGTIERKKDILFHFKPGGIQLTRYEVADIEYDVFSDIGIVSGKGIIAGSFDGYAFKHDVLFIDIFRYIDDMWRYFKSQVTEIQAKEE